MAFLCPIRMRKNKKKKGVDALSLRLGSVDAGIGRITGSASIETLVRVGIEKENGFSPDSRMVVLHDFSPCVDDELLVKRGTVINILYQENDWVYVISEQTQEEGFVPHAYCAPYGTQLANAALNIKKKIPRDLSTSSLLHPMSYPNSVCPSANNEMGQQTMTQSDAFISSVSHEANNLSHEMLRISADHRNVMDDKICQNTSPSYEGIHPFLKYPAGRYIVLYTFISRDENDLSVERGEFVTVLNKDDPDWYWILRSDDEEGFVPSAFVYPADVLPGDGQMSGRCQHTEGVCDRNNASFEDERQLYPPQNSTRPPDVTDGASHAAREMGCLGTELIMLYEYKAQTSDDVTVHRGEWIYADLSSQTVDGWLWVYSPRLRRHGFIPKAYARPPAMTSL